MVEIGSGLGALHLDEHCVVRELASLGVAHGRREAQRRVRHVVRDLAQPELLWRQSGCLGHRRQLGLAKVKQAVREHYERLAYGGGHVYGRPGRHALRRGQQIGHACRLTGATGAASAMHARLAGTSF